MTTTLSDMQLIILATASQREDGSILPPPQSLGDQAGRIRKAIEGLVRRKLASEIMVDAESRLWRKDKVGRVGLVISERGRTAIHAEEADLPAVPIESVPAAVEIVTPETPSQSPRGGSKQARLIELLGRVEGASLNDMVEATGWLPHTTRAALTGLRKTGHAIIRAKVGDASRYSIAAA